MPWQCSFKKLYFFAPIIIAKNYANTIRQGLPAEARQLSPPPPPDKFVFSCEQLVEFFKEISEKLARPG